MSALPLCKVGTQYSRPTITVIMMTALLHEKRTETLQGTRKSPFSSSHCLIHIQISFDTHRTQVKVSNTSVWIPGKQSGWGIPGDRFWSLPGHHCSEADPALGAGPVFQPNQADDSFRASSLWLDLDQSSTPASVLLSTYPLLVIWNDAAHKVRVGVAERRHQLGERFFVELPDCTKHALLGFIGRAKSCLRHPRDLIQTHDPVHWWK